MSASYLLANGLFVVAIIAVVLLLVFFGVGKRDKSKKITMNAVVRDIKDEMKGTGNPVWSRSGPVYMATDSCSVVFEFEDGGTVSLKVRQKVSKDIIIGTRGKLTFKNGVLISFVADK